MAFTVKRDLMELAFLNAKLANSVTELRQQFMAIHVRFLRFPIHLVWKVNPNAMNAALIDTVHDLVCQKLTALNVLLVMTASLLPIIISQIELI